jgi:hypothetical protein
MMQTPILFTAFITLSVLAALTEGLSISLLIPILDSQSMGNSFADVPVLGHVSGYFDNLHGSEKLVVAASFMLVVVIFRGALQMAVQSLSVLIPIEVQRRLTVTSYTSLMSANIGRGFK